MGEEKEMGNIEDLKKENIKLKNISQQLISQNEQFRKQLLDMQNVTTFQSLGVLFEVIKIAQTGSTKDIPNFPNSFVESCIDKVMQIVDTTNKEEDSESKTD